MDLSRFTTEASIKSEFKADYDFGEEPLRDLYRKAKRDQWNAEADIDWSCFDPDVDVIDRNSDFLSRLECVRQLPGKQQTEIFRTMQRFLISQILHGEQAAMMTCGQLVNVVPDVNAKLAASVQVVDEARHVEVFARYVDKLGGHFPIDNDLKIILEQLLAESDWEAKCVGMQVIIESVALSFFRLGQKLGIEPVFRSFIDKVQADESRHVAYGVLTLKDRIPQLSRETREQLENWTYDAIVRIAGRAGKPGFASMIPALTSTTSVDFAALLPKLMQEMQNPQDLDLDDLADPVADPVLPNLLQVGLVPERHIDGYLAQGWRVDRDEKTVENLHTFHTDTREIRAEFAGRGRDFSNPLEATLA